MRVLGDCETVKESRREIHRAKRRREAKSRRRRLAKSPTGKSWLADFSRIASKIVKRFQPHFVRWPFFIKTLPTFSTLHAPNSRNFTL